jgi:hypothetical protein
MTGATTASPPLSISVGNRMFISHALAAAVRKRRRSSLAAAVAIILLLCATAKLS